MDGQYNLRSPAVKRLMREAQELSVPNEQFYAQPLEDNLFEWHFTIRGPVDSEFENGIYHGRIVLPSEYPMKPPSIILLTANGRFETNKKICLSISGHHPESWQPSWSLRTALLAIIGFMPTHGNGAIGSLDYPAEERKVLAKKSHKYECPQCGNVSGLLKPVTEASKSLSQEARELGAQINLQGEQEKKSTTASDTTEAASSSSTPPAVTQQSSAALNGSSNITAATMAVTATVAQVSATSSSGVSTAENLSTSSALGPLPQSMFFPTTASAVFNSAAAAYQQSAAAFQSAAFHPAAAELLQQPIFYPSTGTSAHDPAAIAAAAAAAASAHHQMMMGQFPLGSNSPYTPMFWMQTPPLAGNVPQSSTPIQNLTSGSPMYNFSPIPPIHSQSFFMNPAASATVEMPGFASISVPAQNIIHNVIPASAAGLIPGLMSFPDHLNATVGEATSIATSMQNGSLSDDGTDSKDKDGKVLVNKGQMSGVANNMSVSSSASSSDTADFAIRLISTFPATTAIATSLPSSLMASVPTVVSGVPTIISGVPAVVPGIHPMVPGIPAQSVLVGVSSLHEDAKPVSTGLTTSSAAPTAIFHWVHYAPTMLPMVISPDHHRASLYARPRMLTTTNTSHSEDRRPHASSGLVGTPNKAGDENNLENSVKSAENTKLDEVKMETDGDSAIGVVSTNDNSVDNVKQSVIINGKSNLNTQAEAAGVASKTSPTVEFVSSVDGASSNSSSAEHVGPNPFTADSNFIATASSTAASASSLSTSTTTAVSSSPGGTELRRRTQPTTGAGAPAGVIRAVNQSAELPPDVPRMGAGPIGGFILNVIVVILVGCIVALLCRRLFPVG